jgi:hypothetical protein
MPEHNVFFLFLNIERHCFLPNLCAHEGIPMKEAASQPRTEEHVAKLNLMETEGE